MAVLLDTGVLYAYYDRRDAWHTAAIATTDRRHFGAVTAKLPLSLLP
ncbi:MAG: hypothetical protein KGZ60_11975 [Truepera sp.]|nr:hypothetical protein [Truepera sp.]